MFALLGLVLAASSPSALLESSLPWWEKITVIVDDRGAQQSCTYESSLSPLGAERCDPVMAATIPKTRAAAARPGSGLFSRLTFERRFSPGPRLDSARLQAGDVLLGQQVMFLTIAADGSIGHCRVVGRSGDLVPAYDCDSVKSEQFRVAASAGFGPPRQAFMTISVYGHQEQIV